MFDVLFLFCRACLDTSFKGQLSECELMGVYRETFDIGTLSEEDQLSYAINIYPEDNILEIVSMCCMYKTCMIVMISTLSIF